MRFDSYWEFSGANTTKSSSWCAAGLGGDIGIQNIGDIQGDYWAL